MDSMYSQIDLNSYVAKYMDEMGCSFDQACNDLGLDKAQVFSQGRKDELY